MAPIDKDPKNKIQQVKGSQYQQEDSKNSNNFEDPSQKRDESTDNSEDDFEKQNNQPDNQNESDTGTNIEVDDLFML